MKIVSLYEEKDIENSGLVGSAKLSGITKQIKRIVFKPESKQIGKIPKTKFDMLIYKQDILSNTMVGVDEYKNCDLLKDYNNGIVEIAFAERNSYNTDDIKKIRSSRIGLFLQDDENED